MQAEMQVRDLYGVVLGSMTMDTALSTSMMVVIGGTSYEVIFRPSSPGWAASNPLERIATAAEGQAYYLKGMLEALTTEIEFWRIRAQELEARLDK